jgi:predicted metal-dependent phosphoesterase TrpH
MKTPIRLEFHCHTRYSPDSLAHPRDVLEACRRKGIDRVVITDHNTITGALVAKDLDPARVIIGEEIMTTEGELLAAFLTEEVPAGLTPEETIDRLRAQGAFISVSHPFDVLRNGHWRRDHLLRIVSRVDAVEVFNARCMWPGFNAQARHFAEQHRLAGTVGSDAHTILELGNASIWLEPFNDARSLAAALEKARFQTSLSAPWVHLASRYAVWRKKQIGVTIKP